MVRNVIERGGCGRPTELDHNTAQHYITAAISMYLVDCQGCSGTAYTLNDKRCDVGDNEHNGVYRNERESAAENNAHAQIPTVFGRQSAVLIPQSVDNRSEYDKVGGAHERWSGDGRTYPNRFTWGAPNQQRSIERTASRRHHARTHSY
jgi:hypothetical protein